MTREEALRKLKNHLWKDKVLFSYENCENGLIERDYIKLPKLISYWRIKAVISEIYDELESRICKNCKYVEAKDGDAHACDILMSLCKMQADKLIKTDFGCVLFERK